MQAENRKAYLKNQGWLGPVDALSVSGWAIGDDVSKPVELAVIVNGEEHSRVVADLFREAVRDRGMHPDGKCGFRLTFPENHKLKRGDVVRVRSVTGNVSIINSPLQFGMPCSPTFANGVAANCLIVGHSHLGCMQAAYSNMENSGLDACFIQLHHHKVEQSSASQRKNSEVLSSAVLHLAQEWLSAFDRVDARPVLVISPLGNEHNALGLVNHPVPFDYVLPELPALPVSDSAKVVPYQAMRDVMVAHCSAMFKIAEELSKLPVAKRYWVEVPPPIGDEEYIRNHPHDFKETINRNGLSPAYFRYKAWWLYSRIIREWCENNGWGYISVPEIGKDEQGFLAQAAWPYWDSVHGNAWFGRVMLEQILSVTSKDSA